MCPSSDNMMPMTIYPQQCAAMRIREVFRAEPYLTGMLCTSTHPTFKVDHTCQVAATLERRRLRTVLMAWLSQAKGSAIMHKEATSFAAMAVHCRAAVGLRAWGVLTAAHRTQRNLVERARCRARRRRLQSCMLAWSCQAQYMR